MGIRGELAKTHYTRNEYSGADLYEQKVAQFIVWKMNDEGEVHVEADNGQHSKSS